MSAIAYIADSEMLENHRLRRSDTMNFWRLSPNVNFRDFRIGDVVFFLSKAKSLRHKGEKGIVGFGTLEALRISSPRTMWEKYQTDNGYNNKKDFYDTLKKLSKDNKLPSKISSMYLKDVIFLQNPTFLSEYGLKISKQVESYIYLNDPKVPMAIFEYAKKAQDIWTMQGNEELCDHYQIRLALTYTAERLEPLSQVEKTLKELHKTLKAYQKDHEEYRFIGDHDYELYTIKANHLQVLTAYDKHIDLRTYLGQALLYRKALEKIYPYDLDFTYTILGHEEWTMLLND